MPLDLQEEVNRMNATGIVILVIAVLVVIAIIVVVWVMGRRRRMEADRRKAAEIRQNAQDEALSAREREAKAAQAAADAQQAEVDAERLRREAAARNDEAQAARTRAGEKINEADRIDPDVTTGRRADASEHTDAGGNEHDATPHDREPGAHQAPVIDDGRVPHPPR
ncbi:MAG: hypothetical protein QOH55_1627 [Microbacteriaceae bacterium]|nr:hypothetical protein [Microbacteriaceae bacterium]